MRREFFIISLEVSASKSDTSQWQANELATGSNLDSLYLFLLKDAPLNDQISALD
jgi:hypothetical protein